MPNATFSRDTLDAFLASTRTYAARMAGAADKNRSGIISRDESASLGDMKDTYDLYVRKGERVGVKTFVSMYVRRAEMAVKLGTLPEDMQDNIANWVRLQSKPVDLSAAEKLAAVRAVYGGFGSIDDSLAPYSNLDGASLLVRNLVDATVREFDGFTDPAYPQADMPDVAVHEVYASESNHTVVAYLVHAYVDMGNGEDLTWLDRAYDLDGKVILDEVSTF